MASRMPWPDCWSLAKDILTTLRTTEHQKHIGPSSGGEFRHGWKEDCTAGGSADHRDRYSVHGAQPGRHLRRPPDRTSVVQGKSGSVRVDLGGRRTLKKKKEKT